MTPALALLVLLSSSPATPAVAPSMAVLRLQVSPDIPPDLAEALMESAANRFRRTRRFSRVVTPGDVEMAANVELQKQLMDCSAASCLAEIAGALGVDLIFSGNIARAGSLWLFTARILQTRDAASLASETRTIPAQDPSALLGAMDAMVDALEQSLGKVHTVAVVAEPAAPPPSRLPVLLRAAGGLGVGVGVLGVLAAVLGGALAAASILAVNIPGSQKVVTGLQAGFVGGLVLVPTAVLVGLLAAGAGAALLVASFVAG